MAYLGREAGPCTVQGLHCRDGGPYTELATA